MGGLVLIRVLELLGSKTPVDRVLVGPGPRRDELLGSGATGRGLTPLHADRQALDRAAGRAGHQGTVAMAPAFRYADLAELGGVEERLALVLDGVQDPRNLGAILRSARAAG